MNYLQQAQEVIKLISQGYEIEFDTQGRIELDEYFEEIKEEFDIILDKVKEGSLSGFIKRYPVSLDDYETHLDFFNQVATDYCNNKAKVKADCQHLILVKFN